MLFRSAEHLQEEGIAADVIEFNTIKPLDEESIIAAAKKTGALVTVEDNTILGGFGAAVTEVLSETIPTPVKRIGILDSFGESGAPEELYRKNKMTVEDYYVHGRKIKADDIDLNNPEEMQLLLTSMLCNDSSIAEGKELGDPTETALINIGSKLGVSYETERAACSRVGEIPFDSDRKLIDRKSVV